MKGFIESLAMGAMMFLMAVMTFVSISAFFWEDLMNSPDFGFALASAWLIFVSLFIINMVFALRQDKR